ncbi:MAG: sulfur carrier protein ThiS [Candidatus Coatesbacteria bacterium]|nr:sulfur carrier protein ThiS [Candidatus Coatesbacteria bacterium]
MIKVNGNEYEWQENLTVSEMLKNCNYNFPLIIVKVNGELIPRSNYKTQLIPDNAEVEATHLIGGG